MDKVAIVGAGLGGLSAAAHLLSQGHEVTVFEREASAGGRALRKELSIVVQQYLQ